jgi:hypothetical protein
MTRTHWGAGLLALVVGAAALGCSAQGTPSGSATEDGARLEAVIDSVREALNEAQTNNVPGFPPLKSVTIKLQTTASRSAGGEVQLLVFSLGTRYSSDAASTVELEMVPPKTRETESLMAGPGVKEALAQAINLAKAGVLKASKGSPPLVMKNISINLKFAVELQGSAGASVTLVPLGIGATGRISRERVHTVSLVFGS